MAAARSWSCACSSGFGLRAGDHLQAREASPGSIVSSALDLPPRKVPISASCAELLASELRRGLDLAPLPHFLSASSDDLSPPIDVQGIWG